MYGSCTDVWGSVQMYRAYICVGQSMDGVQMYGRMY